MLRAEVAALAEDGLLGVLALASDAALLVVGVIGDAGIGIPRESRWIA
jgi:hypothetical protein